jgi:predicted PurR-regulated permease PerM
MSPSVSPEPEGARPVALAPMVTAAAGVAALWLAVLALHLTPALFAGLITYGGTRMLAGGLQRLRPGLRHAQGWGLTLLVIVMGGVGGVLVERGAAAAAAGNGYAGLLQHMASILEQMRTFLSPWLAAHLPVSLEALREVAVAWLRGHAAEVELWGGYTVRGIGHAVAGVVIGALAALQLPARSAWQDTTAPLAVALRRGFNGLVDSFTAVVFSQLRIATINTVLTAVYLLGVLPLLGTPLPLASTLVAATFVASLIPVMGNLVSNTMIVVVSLTQSLVIAGLSLAWLIGIHKLEYFLNAHIIGRRIRAQVWELLIAMLALEALFGLAGLIRAPVLYAQMKHTLHEHGWL